MSQTALAKKVGVSQPLISKILATGRRPSWTLAKRLAEATGTRPELWLEGTSQELRAALARWTEREKQAQQEAEAQPQEAAGL